MYAIYNKESSRLYQYGEHETLDTAGIACARALQNHPRSGAHIREIQRQWEECPNTVNEEIKMVKDHFAMLRKERTLTAGEDMLLDRLMKCPPVIAELTPSDVENAGFDPSGMTAQQAEDIASRLGETYRARHLGNHLYDLLTSQGFPVKP